MFLCCFLLAFSTCSSEDKEEPYIPPPQKGGIIRVVNENTLNYYILDITDINDNRISSNLILYKKDEGVHYKNSTSFYVYIDGYYKVYTRRMLSVIETEYPNKISYFEFFDTLELKQTVYVEGGKLITVTIY